MRHAKFGGLTLATLAAALMFIVGVPAATAVNDLGLFELDENAVTQATPGDDWEALAGGGGSALLDTFVTDPVESSADDIFDGGQTKDTENLDDWFWKGAEANDKNDIEHAFASAYEHPTTGDLIIYFGLDRMDNSGDAAAGFWFLKKPVEQKTIDSDGDGDTENVFVHEGTNTLATHSVGDTLVQTDFTKGGSIERIEAYQWGVAPTGDPVQPGSPLRNISTGADCDVASPGNNLCGQVNKNSETVPANWPEQTVNGVTDSYFFKGPGGVVASPTFPTATFFEGGVNATKLLGADFCAAQVLAETRQSQSETAVLEDKAEAAFNLCAIDVTKTGPEKSKVGDDTTYTIKVTNTGAVTLFKQKIIDDVIGDLTANAGCDADLDPGESCTITVDHTVQAGAPDPLVNTVDVIYDRKETLTGDEVTASDNHSVNLFQPSITLTKTGDERSKIGDKVDYTITLSNTSSTDTPNLNCTISDPTVGVSEPVTLASGASKVVNVNDFVIPANAADPFPNEATATCSPQGFPNVLEKKASHNVNLFQPSITLTKTGDERSKIGDKVDYTITLSNTSSTDTPNLNCTISDPTVGVSEPVTLASGASKVVNVNDFVIPNGAADPFPNEATATCSPQGFPNVLEKKASHNVNLFQPSITLTKTGDERSKIGDKVDYTITLSNTSSTDTPNLNCTISDPTVGVSEPVTLASGASKVVNVNDFVIPNGAADPFPNEATATCSPQGFPNVLEKKASHNVNLFQPSITLTKTGDERSKIGDKVDYTITLSNTSSTDTPNLNCTISDPTVGVSEPVTLASGASKVVNVNDFVIPANAADPFPNEATATCSPQGFPNVLEKKASHNVNLFQPSITLTKTGDERSKIGDKVDYTITLSNTSSTDTPNLNCTISDPTVGVSEPVTLASGASKVVNVNDFVIPNGAADPFPNEATATCSPQGFPNVLEKKASHNVNLFQPNVDVEKECDDYTKAGDTLACTITLKNTSSNDTPDLIMGEVKDKMVKTSGGDTVVDLGDLLDPANTYVTNSNCTATLVDDASCSIDVKITVPALGPTPDLTNKVSVLYHPDGFPNDIVDNDSVDIDTLHPSFTVTKVCTTDPVDQGGTASFKITYNNTGDANLVFTPNEADEGGTVAVGAGQSESVTINRSVPDGATSVSNTVTGKVTLAATYGLSNEYTYSDNDTCSVRGKAKVVKTVSGQPPAADQTFTFELRQGASALAEGAVLESKNTDASGNIGFTTQLNPGATYQLCEWVFPGWNTSLAGDGPLFVPASILPPSLPNPNVNNLTVCVDFKVTSGQTRTFTVDNTPPPGGRALTIGFWKNWSSCSNSKGKGQDPMLDLALAYATQNTTNPPGGLVVSAQNPGSSWPNYGAAWYRVLKGEGTSTEDNIKPAPGCEKAVSLLNKTALDGKKKASDPLFNMTAQLVAAQLNRFMGAGINGPTIMNINKAVLLNGNYEFNGTIYSPKLTAADTNKANCLAKQLDNYNNNRPVSAC